MSLERLSQSPKCDRLSGCAKFSEQHLRVTIGAGSRFGGTLDQCPSVINHRNNLDERECDSPRGQKADYKKFVDFLGRLDWNIPATNRRRRQMSGRMDARAVSV